VVGITTDQLKKLILPQHTKDLEVEDGIRAAQKEVAEVRQEGADVIILLSHLGLSGTGTSQYTQIENDDRKLAKEIPQIDVILGGHSHTELFDGLKVGNTLIAQAGYRGVYIGKVDLVWDTEKSKVVSSRAQLIPVLPSESEDPQIKQIVDPYKKRFEKELGVPIFETRVPLIGLRIDSPTPELSLGNFVCDALKEETGSEVAFFNSGGIRSSIPKGIVRKRDVLEAFPFRNQVTTGILKGSEIIDLLTDGSREVMSGGGVLQVSGLNYEVVNGAVTHVEVNGKPIEPKTDYLFATNSFVSAGGDKLKTMLKARKLRTLSLSVDEALIRFGKKQKISEATTEGRIIVRNESD
ncbi:MAG: hypothetical protein EB120_13415, partial [Proteobacteria bacterium]|nr:hypothetical protein [Pseudomonadota bacterium]